ncbi:syndecan domain-containing protein [Rutstroemia sp. NJR-2017a WRK4]|nr:syndecan domain-containing protein [Rutstroemia sp. NJR-2017a WRK4]
MHLLALSSLITLWTWTGSSSASLITQRPPHPTPFPDANLRIAPRQTTTFGSTCGYHNGNTLLPWIAPPGFDCRQSSVGLWGFCPNTYRDAQECSMLGFCIDNRDCASGCGISGQKTTQCTDSTAPSCYFAFLQSQQQTYTMVSCADHTNEYFLATPNTTSTEGVAPASSTSPSSVSAGSVTSSSSSSSSTASSQTISSSQATNTNTAASSTPSANSSSSSSSSNSGSSNNIGAIVGGVLGGLALIFLIVVGLIFLRRSSHSAAKSEPRPETAYLPAYGPVVPQPQGLHGMYGRGDEARELIDTSPGAMSRLGSMRKDGKKKGEFGPAELHG